MNSATVLSELKELRETWKRQGFAYTNEQQKRHLTNCVKCDDVRVNQMYEEGLVYKSSAK